MSHRPICIVIAFFVALAPIQATPCAEFEEITPKSTKAIERGTQWLLSKAQNKDGGFGSEAGSPSDVSCTAMVGLVLLSQGNTPECGPHCRTLRRIVDYLMKKSQGGATGQLLNESSSNVQAKIGQYGPIFFTTLFFSQILGQMRNDEPNVREVLKRLVQATSKAQQADGSWGGQSWAPMLGTVMGWVSLRSSSSVGLKVEASAARTAKHIVEQMKATLAQHQTSWMHELYKNASGLRVLYGLGMHQTPVARQAFKDLVKTVQQERSFKEAGGEEYLAFYLITSCMMQKGGDDWKAWYPTVRDQIIKVQNTDGTWTGMHCITSRTFCTAAALLTLQAPQRMLPIDQE